MNIVCCDTCFYKDKKDKGKPCGFSSICLRFSDLMLYWSEEHGYIEKKYRHFSYDKWKPMQEEIKELFFKEEEFQL